MTSRDTEFRREIEEAAARLSIPVRQLSDHEIEEVWSRLQKEYLDHPRGGWFWENLKVDQPTVSFRLHDEAWRRLSQVFPPGPLLLIVDNDPALMFEIGSADLSAVIGECFPFEFSVLDPDMTGMICVNHHDYAIAIKAGIDWIEPWRSELEFSSVP